jgi:hypothetical protein
MAMRCRNEARWAGSWFVIGVCVGPGATAFTRTPAAASSTASVCVMLMIPALLAP